MSVLSEVRLVLATTIGVACDLTPIAGVPTNLVPGTVYVRPSRYGDYITRDDPIANFINPAVNMQAILVFPILDVSAMQDKMDDYVLATMAALEGDPRLGGRTSDIVLTRVVGPGYILNETLGLEFTFAPFLVRGLPPEE